MECTKCKEEIQFLEIHLKWKKTKDGHIKHKCKSCGKINGITQSIDGSLVTY